jgi:tetratricopeptide (TPR) repeat protein
VTIPAVLLIGLLPIAGGLSEAGHLSAIYDLILDARFPEAAARLREACPPAPAEACLALDAVSILWQIQIDPESRLLDQKLNDAADRAIAAADAWTRREPARAEAWFYLAGAYAPLVQWRILRGERLSAARDGARVKSALERALGLDPTLADAEVGIGLYHYYAGVAPTYAKVLRLFLFLPGGDRRRGLSELTEARDHGQLLRGEADYQLHLIYLWYENRPRDALALLEDLDAKHPFNPLFLQRIAEATETSFHDRRASADAWRALRDRARAGRVYEPRVTETRARIGLAAELIAAGDLDAAIDELQIVIDSHPIAPAGARNRAEALLRDARARKNF